MGKFICPSCKYEYLQNYENGKPEIIIGDELPIRLYLSNSIKVSIHTEYYEEKKVNLIGCPKCKTIIIED